MPDTAAPLPADTSGSELATARLLRRTVQQWPIVAACGVLAAVAAYGVSASSTKKYEATTTVQLSDVDLGSVIVGQSLQQQGQDAATKAATNAKLVTLPLVRQATAKALGGRISPGALADEITVTPTPGTTLVEITARDPSPTFAAEIANATRVAFIQTRRSAAEAPLQQASVQVSAQLDQIPDSQRGSATAVELRSRLEQINTLRTVSNGGVESAQPASVPTASVAPRPKRDAILGLLAGLVLGAGVALLRARVDDRVRDTEELSDLWGLPIVGLVPETDGLRHSGVVIPDGPALEALSLARTNLRYLQLGTAVKTVILTSALEGEGKSTITWNLGLAAGLAKSRVLVIEADLRRPMVTSRLNIAVKQGLSEILAGFASLSDSIVPVTVTDDARGVSVTVDVLPAGLAPPSPITLLELPAMAELLAAVRADYDIVLIDTPPATIVADAMAFMDHVDGVIVVSRLGRLRRSSLLRLRSLLDGIHAPVLGQIVNSGASAKAYGYTAYTRNRPTPDTPPLEPPTGDALKPRPLAATGTASERD